MDDSWTHLNKGFDGLNRRWAEGEGGLPDAGVPRQSLRYALKGRERADIKTANRQRESTNIPCCTAPGSCRAQLRMRC